MIPKSRFQERVKRASTSSNTMFYDFKPAKPVPYEYMKFFTAAGSGARATRVRRNSIYHQEGISDDYNESMNSFLPSSRLGKSLDFRALKDLTSKTPQDTTRNLVNFINKSGGNSPLRISEQQLTFRNKGISSKVSKSTNFFISTNRAEIETGSHDFYVD